MKKDIDKTNKILFDWFAFTVHELTVDEVFIILGLAEIKDKFEIRNGYNGYRKRYYYESISIHFDGNEEQGIHIEMTGQGCRAFETFSTYGDFDELARTILGLFKSKITRIDIAYDDFQNYLPMETIWWAVFNEDFVSPSGLRSSDVRCSTRNHQRAYSCYLGSEQSKIRFRFYDKAAEQNVDFQWTRLEIQLRDGLAESFLLQFLEIDSTKTISDLFFGVINSYFRFIENDNSRKTRCSSPEWWENFLETHNQIKIFTKKKVDYNMRMLDENVEQRWGNAIHAYISVHGVPALLESLQKTKPFKSMPLKYKKIVTDYVSDFANSRTVVERKLPTGEVIEEFCDFPKRIEQLIDELDIDLKE